MRLTRGFTLIELLVVIALIAVLIGILLPALGHARKSARNVMSLSQLHQISAGVQMYADEHRSYYPDVTESTGYFGPVGNFPGTWMYHIASSIPDRQGYRSPLDDNETAWNLPDGDPERRLTSYGLNAFVTSNHPPYWGLRQEDVRQAARFITLAEMEDHFPDDHFTPMLWGEGAPFTPATGTDPTGAPYDVTEDRDLNWLDGTGVLGIALTRNGGTSGNYGFADGHASAHRLDDVFSYTPPSAPTRNDFDPKFAN